MQQASGMKRVTVRRRIGQWFGRWGYAMVRYRWLALVSMLAVAALLVSGLPTLVFDNSIEAFLHADDPVMVQYNEFRDQFGGDDFITIAIEPREVFALDFLERLRAFHEDLESEVPYVDEVTSMLNARSTRGNESELIVEDLIEEWPRSAQDVAALKERVFANPLYLDTLISRDGRFTTVTIQPNTYSSHGVDDDALTGFDDVQAGRESTAGELEYLTESEYSELLAVVRRVMTRYEEPDFRMYLAGGPVLGERIDAAMQSDIVVFLSLSTLIILAVLYVLFRRLSGMLLPLLVVVLSLLSTMGAIAHLGIPFSIATEILPSLLLTVGVCASVHILVIFYQQLAGGASREDAIAYALEHSGLAILMSSLTTMGGLMSFAGAEAAPISNFGVVAPLGVMVALVFTLVLLPALLAVVPLRQMDPGTRQGNAFLTRLLLGFGEISIRRPWSVVVMSALLMALAGLGASRLRFSQDELQWFPEGEPLREAMDLIDREFKGALSLEAVVETGEENGLHRPELLRRLDQIHAANEAVRHDELFIGKTLSLVDVVKETHQALNENQPSYYSVPSSRQVIAQELLLFENSGSDDLEELVDSQFSKARISMKVPWADSMLYPAFLARIQEQFERILGDHVRVTLTGVGALYGRTSSAVVVSMARSYVLALLVITPLMILLIGSLRRGLLSMAPNLAPVLLTLGLMGWLDVPLDMATLLIGGIIIGLAVDDTIHFMHRFNQYYEEVREPGWAVRETLRTTGTAMLFTSVVLCGGFLVYVRAYMVNVATFGVLAAFATMTAFLADVTLAPALMVLVTRGRARLEA